MTYEELKLELRKNSGYRANVGKEGVRGYFLQLKEGDDRKRIEALVSVAVECFFREINGETIPSDLTREIEDAQTRPND